MYNAFQKIICISGKQKSSRKIHKIDVIHIKFSTPIKLIVIAEDIIIIIYKKECY